MKTAHFYMKSGNCIKIKCEHVKISYKTDGSGLTSFEIIKPECQLIYIELLEIEAIIVPK